MLKVHKGRRDDVSTVHGPLSGPAPSIPYLIGLGRRSSVREYPSTAVSSYLHPFHAMPKPETTTHSLAFTLETRPVGDKETFANFK